MVRVKVCGITNLEDALVAATAGADALGFNFWPRSPRFIEPQRAATIVAQLPPFVTSVGVFVDESRSRIESVAGRVGLAAAQLHGDEGPEETKALAATSLLVLKALRVGPGFQPQQLQRYRGVAAFLLDAEVKGQRGGTGSTFDWKRARAAGRYGRIIVAGGLTVENVAEAIRQAQPYGVDVCTGVEKAPGQKDHERLRAFLQRAKGTVTG
jgi:phosphoribosylanthranilate isomerase